MQDALSCVACEQLLLSGGCLVQTAGDLAMLTQRLTSEEGMTMMRRCLAHPISGEANERCDSTHTRLATNTAVPFSLQPTCYLHTTFWANSTFSKLPMSGFLQVFEFGDRSMGFVENKGRGSKRLGNYLALPPASHPDWTKGTVHGAELVGRWASKSVSHWCFAP